MLSNTVLFFLLEFSIGTEKNHLFVTPDLWLPHCALLLGIGARKWTHHLVDVTNRQSSVFQWIESSGRELLGSLQLPPLVASWCSCYHGSKQTWGHVPGWYVPLPFAYQGTVCKGFFFLGTGNRCKKAEKVPDCMGITNLEKEIEVDLNARLFHTGIPTRKTTHHRVMLREISEVIVPQWIGDIRGLEPDT